VLGNKGINMKKISILSMISALVLPAFAEEAKVETPAPVKDAVVEEVAPVVETPATEIVEPLTIVKEETINPKTKFPRGVQLGVGVSSTTGLNGFIGYNNKNFDSFWAKRFGVRLDFASTSPVKSLINKGIDNYMGDKGLEINDEISIVDGNIKAHHIGALVDFYPFGNTWFFGGWRITGGYVFGDMDIDADLKGTVKGLQEGVVEFKFYDTTYRYLGNSVYGTAKADCKFHGPYLGTGFDLGLFWGIKIYMDAGVVFTNKAAELDLDVNVDNLQYKDGGGNWKSFAGDPNYNTLVEEFNANKAEELEDAQDELNKYKFYPIVKLGLMYRF
jgi:hypothetical protein